MLLCTQEEHKQSQGRVRTDGERTDRAARARAPPLFAFAQQHLKFHGWPTKIGSEAERSASGVGPDFKMATDTSLQQRPTPTKKKAPNSGVMHAFHTCVFSSGPASCEVNICCAWTVLSEASYEEEAGASRGAGGEESDADEESDLTAL